MEVLGLLGFIGLIGIRGLGFISLRRHQARLGHKVDSLIEVYWVFIRLPGCLDS